MSKKSEKINFAFFGTPDFSVKILDELANKNLVPELVVTAPDRKRGRGQKISPPAVAQWAHEHDITTLQPEQIGEHLLTQLKQNTPKKKWDVFVVAAYGQIIPLSLLEMPEHGCLNVHPSLLPKCRGAAPLQCAILEENETGVTIMQMDEKLDHGPIVSQEKIDIDDWPPTTPELEEILAHAGGKLLADTLPKWIAGDIEAKPQDHPNATYMGKIDKSDAEIDLSDDPKKNLRKIRAYQGWPKPYFFTEIDGEKTRIIITAAHLESDELIIDRVKPAGENEMSYEDFKSN